MSLSRTEIVTTVEEEEVEEGNSEVGCCEEFQAPVKMSQLS